jgi:hypothetical protein
MEVVTEMDEAWQEQVEEFVCKEGVFPLTVADRIKPAQATGFQPV